MAKRCAIVVRLNKNNERSKTKSHSQKRNPRGEHATMRGAVVRVNSSREVKERERESTHSGSTTIKRG